MRGASDPDPADIVRDYAELYSVRKVARKHHCGEPVIRRALTEAGVKIERRISPETRAHLREIWLTRWRDLAHKEQANTHIERRLHIAMIAAGLSFETQVRVGNFIADIRLLDYPILIEADGMWHERKQTAEKDRQRDVETAELGYVTFRFNSYECNARARECIQTVQDYIANAEATGRWTPPPHHELIARVNDWTGENHPAYGTKHSPETRAKQSQALKGRSFTDEHRARISDARRAYYEDPANRAAHGERQRGKTLSAEHRAKLSEAGKGRVQSTESRAKMSQALKGRVMSPEWRAKLSESKRGRTLTPEHRAKVAEAGRGRKHGSETLAKMSEGQKKSWENRSHTMSPEQKAAISAGLRAANQRKREGQTKI